MNRKLILGLVCALALGASCVQAALISQWDFEQTGGNTIADAMGINTGTIWQQDTGLYQWVTSSNGLTKFGDYALKLTGKAAFVSNDAWPPGIAGFKVASGTVAVWAYVPAVTTDWTDIVSGPVYWGGGVTDCLRVEMTGGATQIFGIPGVGGMGISSKVVADNSYHHFAYTWLNEGDPGTGTVSFYVDGELVGSSVGFDRTAITYGDGSCGVFLNARNAFDTWGAGSGGTFIYDGLQVYDNALNLAEIQQLIPTPQDAVLTGTVTPGDYGQDLADITVKVELITGGTTVRVFHASLDSNGVFTIPNVEIGTYDVGVKASAWLRKVVPSVSLISKQTTDLGAIFLPGGDLDGDNEVTSTDLSILGLNLGIAGD